MNQPTVQNDSRITGPAWLAGTLIGVGLTTVLVGMEPTGSELKDQYLSENTAEFKQLRFTLDELATQARAVPTGSVESITTEEQLKELAAMKMDFRDPNPFDAPNPNAAVAQLEDFPENPEPHGSGRSVLQPKTFRMAGPEDCRTLVDSIEALNSTVFYSVDSMKEFHKRFRELEYVVLIRFGGRLKPKIRAEGFEPGYQTAEAFFFDLRGKRLLGGFSFEATTNDKISFSYQNASYKEGSALHALGEQLDKNLETAFWERLHKLIPRSQSNFTAELPYSQEGLDQARQLFKMQKAEAPMDDKPEAR